MLSVSTRRMRQVQVKGHVILDFEFGFTKLLLKDGVDFPDLLPVVRVQFFVQIPVSRDTCVVVPLFSDLSKCVLDTPYIHEGHHDQHTLPCAQPKALYLQLICFCISNR